MTLKAQCLDGTIANVKVSDCPVRISKDLMILANVPMSKLIYNCTLKRCEGKLVEYNYVFDKNNSLIGYLLYKSGWKLYDMNTEEYSEIKEEYTFTQNHDVKLIGKLQTLSEPIVFSVGENRYGIRSIIGRYGGKLMLYVNGNIEYIDILSESEVSIQ